MNGAADYKVQKSEYAYKNLHYYDWGTLDTDANASPGTLKNSSKSVTATKEELLKAITDAGVIGIESSSATVQLCTPSGGVSGNINTNANLNSDGSITYTTDKTGSDNYFYNIKQGDATYGPVRVDVYTYGVSDNIYVLDYSLPVELNEGEAGLTKNDVVSLASTNPYETEFAVAGISNSTSKYGNFEFNDPSLKYTLNKFMNDIDTTTVTVVVKEVGATSVTKTTGVTMTQTITTAPATVMYYEDDFADITYVGEDGNKWQLYDAIDENGNSMSNNEQSADQDSNYGSDPNYEEDKQGILTLDKTNLNEAEIQEADEALSGDASNGTIHAMKVEKTGRILSFDFKGTGFEIISRTTSNNYAVLSVEVKYHKDENDKEGEVVRQFPVITECVNGDLYQVPVISVTDLPYGSYTVTLRAAKSTESATRLV